MATQLEAVISQLGETESTNLGLSSRLCAAKTQLDEQEGQLSEARTRLAAAKNQLVAQEQEISDRHVLIGEVQDATTETLALQTSARLANGQLASTEAMVVVQAQELAAAKRDVATLQNELNARQPQQDIVSRAAQRADALQQQLAEAILERDQFDSQQKELQLDLEAKMAHLDEAKLQLQHCQENTLTLQGSLTEAIKRKSILENESKTCVELQSRNEDLETRLGAEVAARKELKQKIRQQQLHQKSEVQQAIAELQGTQQQQFGKSVPADELIGGNVFEKMRRDLEAALSKQHTLEAALRESQQCANSAVEELKQVTEKVL